MPEKTLFQAPLRVEKRLDNLSHPCGFDVVQTLPQNDYVPEHDEIICFLPDGMSGELEKRAVALAAVPELIQCLDDHCFYCADCDFENNPDQTCQFGRCWKKLRGEK